MKRIAVLTMKAALVLVFMSGVALFAADRGTPAEAKAMLVKAIAHYKAVGRKQALADFTKKKPPFGDRDLYLVCFDSERIVVANGGFPGHVGTPADVVVDVHGIGMGTAAWEAASSSGEVAVHFRWVDPFTHEVVPKTMFFVKIGDNVCGVGTYVIQ